MNKMKFGIVAGSSIAIGYLALRRLRRRQADDEPDAVAIAIEETEAAADHAAAAADHAKRAGEMAVESARAEFDGAGENGEETARKTPGHLRRLGKSWMRR